jgi:acyl-CoA dehydrogenase
MEGGLAETIRYVKDRKAFGKAIAEFPNTKFKLAELATKTHIARLFADSRVQRLYGGTNEIMKELISRAL